MDARGSSQSWNVLVCGDVEKIFGLLVKSPQACSVLDLKKMIKEKTGIALDSQTLFFEEKRLEDEKMLKDYPITPAGSALYLARKPLTIETLDCFGEKSTLKIPNKKSWTVSQLREDIAFKYHLPLDMLILMCEGDILEDGSAKQPKLLSDYAQIVDGCLITVTSVRRVHLELAGYDYTSTTTEAVICPVKSSHQFITKRVQECNGILNNQIKWVDATNSVDDHHEVDPDEGEPYPASDSDSDPDEDEPYRARHSDRSLGLSNLSDGVQQERVDILVQKKSMHTITIQNLGGTKVSINIPADATIHVMRLRELIKEKTGVPTEQQRLAVGTTVMEDWDKKGTTMQLCNYPAIHDGSTLYLVQLTTGKRFNTTDYKPLPRSDRNPSYDTYASRSQTHSYNYINIPIPQEFTQRRLSRILASNGALSHVSCHGCSDHGYSGHGYHGYGYSSYGEVYIQCGHTRNPVSQIKCEKCGKKWMRL